MIRIALKLRKEVALLYDELPFNMADLASLLNLEIKRQSAAKWDVNCPFCQERKGRMNLNMTKNVFRCNRCGEAGGMLDLYGRLYGLDYASACDEIKAALGIGRVEKEYVIKRKEQEKKQPEIPQSEPAEDTVRHKTYTTLLSLLPLAESHEASLVGRGFSIDNIRENGYKSTPVFGFKKLVENLRKDDCTITGVPGFYQDGDGNWTIHFNAKNAGFLVPVRNMDGRIVGMQIRLDHPYDGRKYIWLSSAGLSMGVTSKSPVHFTGKEGENTVYVTEGPLKADLAHCISGKSFAAVAGVNMYGNLPPIMERLRGKGTNLIYETYDMDKRLSLLCQRDYREDVCRECEFWKEGEGKVTCPKKEIKKKNIQNGCKQLYRICKEAGLSSKSLTWDMNEKGEWKGNVKGIDDYLCDLQKRKNSDKA